MRSMLCGANCKSDLLPELTPAAHSPIGRQITLSVSHRGQLSRFGQPCGSVVDSGWKLSAKSIGYSPAKAGDIRWIILFARRSALLGKLPHTQEQSGLIASVS